MTLRWDGCTHRKLLRESDQYKWPHPVWKAWLIVWNGRMLFYVTTDEKVSNAEHALSCYRLDCIGMGRLALASSSQTFIVCPIFGHSFVLGAVKRRHFESGAFSYPDFTWTGRGQLLISAPRLFFFRRLQRQSLTPPFSFFFSVSVWRTQRASPISRSAHVHCVHLNLPNPLYKRSKYENLGLMQKEDGHLMPKFI